MITKSTLDSLTHNIDVMVTHIDNKSTFESSQRELERICTDNHINNFKLWCTYKANYDMLLVMSKGDKREAAKWVESAKKEYSNV